MSVLGIVAARGGSRGVEGKNARLLLGTPLLARAVMSLRQVREIDRVVVSTDSPLLADIARSVGADVPFLRPAALATDGAGKFQVWQHALLTSQSHFGEVYDVVVDLDCTNPLLQPQDVHAVIEHFASRKAQCAELDAVFTVAKARRNPYFNQLEVDESGALKVSKPLPEPVLARQSAPAVYDHMSGVYVLSADYLVRAAHLLDGHAEGYLVSEEKSYDIDSELDFAVVEFLFSRIVSGGSR